jgi:hypothetical protein
MVDGKVYITRSLLRLVGLRLSIARDAGSMKNFQFGIIGPHPFGKGTIGEFALHIQCPWRLVGSEGIVTGSADYYEPVEAGADVDPNDFEAGNLQQERLGDLLRYDASTRSWVNSRDQLTVQSVLVHDFGGFELELSGGFRLQVFPDGSREENWRFFAPGSEEEHVVIAGGRAK